MARQYQVTFSDGQGEQLHVATIACFHAHNAPRLAVRDLPAAEGKALEKDARRVVVEPVQLELTDEKA